jgi:Fur family peroxide stress response transcriptional regulator
MSHAVERLRQAGLKATGPRVILLTALAQNRSHPTAELLYEALQADHPSLSLSTVYQTLDAFIRTGLCRRVSEAGNRLRVDGTPQDHDHAICRTCGEIFDIDRQLLPRSTPPTQLPQDLTVTGLRVEYDVICEDCHAMSNEAGAFGPADSQRATTSRGSTDRRRKS